MARPRRPFDFAAALAPRPKTGRLRRIAPFGAEEGAAPKIMRKMFRQRLFHREGFYIPIKRPLINDLLMRYNKFIFPLLNSHINNGSGGTLRLVWTEGRRPETARTSRREKNAAAKKAPGKRRCREAKRRPKFMNNLWDNSKPSIFHTIPST